MTQEKRNKNSMYNSIHIEKMTLNFGAGKDNHKLDKGIMLLESLTKKKPVKTLSRHRIAAWGIRLGLPIGCKVTLRGKEAVDMLNRILIAKDNRFEPQNFDNKGNFSFGIKDYIEIEGTNYDPKIGMMGMEVAVTLKRKGLRVEKRSRNPSKVGKYQSISKEQAIEYIKSNFKVKIGDDEDEEED